MRLFLAPMEGVVDQHMRYMLSSIGGIDFCVTEFIRVSDVTLPNKVFFKYCPELLQNPLPTSNDDKPEHSSDHALNSRNTRCPTRIQLLGSNPESLANNAAKAASLGAVGIDLNFGCPAKTVNKNRGGACLLNETALLHEIVSEVRKAVPKEIPVTAKIRLGFNDRDSYLDNAKAIEQAGASELFVHARSKADGYKPPAYWNYIADINKELDIPVIANGEIWNLDDFERCRDQSGSIDFMIGRGLIARPDLAKAIKGKVNNNEYEPLPWSEILLKVYLFFRMTCDSYPLKSMGNRLKQWLFYLKMNYPEAHDLFENIKRLKRFEEIDTELKKAMHL